MNDLQDAIAAISQNNPKYPQKAMDMIREHSGEAKPILYRAIDQITQSPDDHDTENMLSFYAVFLLAEFQDKEAFARIMALCSLAPDTVDELLGDVVTESLKDILYHTYNGDLELLKNTIRNPAVYDFARSAMLDVMGQLYLDGSLAGEQWKDFLKELVYTEDLGDEIYTFVVGTICQSHFPDMLPDIRYLFDRYLIDELVYGTYDECVDYMFLYHEWEKRFCKETFSADMLKSWAMFEQEESRPKTNKKDLEKLMRDMSREYARQQSKKVKIGRNDPCPCGSGRKYKHCCLNKPKETTPEPESIQEQQKWLEDYPETASDRKEGRIYLEDYFDSESIEIDRLLYLALHHRAIPIWVERDVKAEERRKYDYLRKAFSKYQEKMKKEGLRSSKEYDEKYSIHYRCQEWLEELLSLLEENNADRELCEEVQSCLDHAE